MTRPMSNNQRLTVHILSETADLSKIRGFCGQVFDAFRGESIGLADEKVHPVQLAVNEAVANVMEHAYDFANDREITCVANRQGDNLVFEIQHDGKPFRQPSEIAPIDHPLVGGMGLYLIQQCVDQTQYGQTDEGRQYIRLVVGLF